MDRAEKYSCLYNEGNLERFPFIKKSCSVLNTSLHGKNHGPENEVTKQFRYGMDFCREDIIVVIMEEALLNPKIWFGPVAEYKLEEVCRVDFSNTERMNKNFDKLVRTLKL